MDKKTDLYALPNIGPKSVRVFAQIDIFSIKDFKKQTPEKIFDTLCTLKHFHKHRALLYVMRAARWYLEHPDGWEQALRWWMFRKPGEGGKVKKKRVY